MSGVAHAALGRKHHASASPPAPHTHFVRRYFGQPVIWGGMAH